MSDRSLTLFVRSLAPEGTGPEQESVIDRLDSLAARREISGYDVVVWGERLAHDSAIAATDAGESLRARIASFRRWADRADVSVEPFFPTHEVDSAVTGRSRRVTDLPAMALAEYEDGELSYVTPNETATGAETVADRLAALAGPGATSERERAAPALD
jgi:hypothetical protein